MKKILFIDRDGTIVLEPFCENCLRLTIGTEVENVKLMEALKAIPL